MSEAYYGLQNTGAQINRVGRKLITTDVEFDGPLIA